MAHTDHLARESRRTDRATRARMLASAEMIADALDGIAERRAEHHAAELERARSNAHSDLGGRLIADVLRGAR